jgi:hypothetical protein
MTAEAVDDVCLNSRPDLQSCSVVAALTLNPVRQSLNLLPQSPQSPQSSFATLSSVLDVDVAAAALRDHQTRNGARDQAPLGG